MLPVTDTERRYLGPSGGRIVKKGHVVADNVGEALTGKAEEAVVAAADAIVEDVPGGPESARKH